MDTRENGNWKSFLLPPLLFLVQSPQIFFCPRAKCTGRKLRERDGKLKILFASKLSQFWREGRGQAGKGKKEGQEDTSSIFHFFSLGEGKWKWVSSCE